VEDEVGGERGMGLGKRAVWGWEREKEGGRGGREGGGNGGSDGGGS